MVFLFKIIHVKIGSNDLKNIGFIELENKTIVPFGNYFIRENKPR